ncbi:uncharacterized protein LOC132697865 [Cylas formicarius]|uniref:uncharacterized protein LOC132697865 n=1 Tax=Cylas formicarius TaxID=197179 RepID=UPI00295869A0|nr:uncharacterized protein LOC132697865 [Cylas formicarius]
MGDYKKNKVLRSTEIHKLNEIYDVALKVNAEDESFYPILEAMYKELEETRTNFYKLHNKIISIICDKQNADELFKIEDDFRKKFDIQYYRIQAIYTQRLMKPTTQSVAIPGEQLPISAYLNLPKPELPTFRGEVTEFRSFLDQFDARVHTVPHLKAIDKFNLLVSCLKGVARDAVDHLDITADNYTIAYDLLKERFNKQIRAFYFPLLFSKYSTVAESTSRYDAYSIQEVCRQPSGRFIVDLPFKEAAPIFPNIRSLALQRFYSLERRLKKQPEIYSQYRDFMNEFIALNHMESIPDDSFSPLTVIIYPTIVS